MPFTWNLTVLTNLLALLFTYTSAAWALIVPPSAISFIATRFVDDAGLANWISAAPTIILTILQVFLGDLSDILGRRVILLAGSLLGFAGTLVSSRASSMGMVIAGQVLGGTGLTCGFLCTPLLQECVPKVQRPIVMAAASICMGAVVISGPIIVGEMIRSDVGGAGEGWRVGFYIAAGLYALSFIAVFAMYHPGEQPQPGDGSRWSRLLHIDWFGIF
jgi:MFS family permease